MFVHRIKVIVLSATFAAVGLAGCLGSTSSSPNADLPAAVKPPCDSAELHTRHSYTTCVNGLVNQMEEDLWCCPDQTTPTTQTLISATTEPCATADAGTSMPVDDSGTVSQGPKCGQVGSDCDSTVCGAKVDGGSAGTCTTKYGTCECVIPSGTCTIKGNACMNVSCDVLGGNCAVYSNGQDEGCVCLK